MGRSPLPPLTGTKQGPDFRIDLRAIVDYNKMGRLLRQKLVGQTFAAGESWPARRIRATVRDVQVRRDGRRVQISVAVTGFTRGTLHLMGTPVFRNCGRQIAIENIDFTVQTRNLFVRLLANRVFQNRIRHALQANARFDVSNELAASYGQLNRALNSELTPQARLVSNLSQFGPGWMWVTPRGVEAGYRIGGQVTVAVNPF